MFYDILWTFLISLSPFGEARVGIPYGVAQELPLLLVFIIGLSGNLLVFPIFYKAIEIANKYLWKHKTYKKGALYLALRARTKTQNVIKKYGVWGLMVFVMIPLPVTGAYIGTIAAFIFRINYQKSYIAVSIGITLSSIMVTILWPLLVSIF
jgi:uncharacterized membrane protein|tara:strand:+ start:169 stop:624 length:456 start_codon:yes stop_codon:yes gene_type:complete